MTSGQETEQVYSYNPGARTGLVINVLKTNNSWTRIT